MNSKILIIAALFGISQPAFSMERENSGHSIDRIGAIFVFAGIAVRIIYLAYYPIVVDDEQLEVLQFGTVDEAILAAREAREPAYIRPLMEAMSKKIALYSLRMPSNPTRALAFLRSMRGIVSVFRRALNAALTTAMNDVGIAGVNGALITPFDAALNAADSAVVGSAARARAFSAAFNTADSTVLNTAWKAAKAAAEAAKARGETDLEAEQGAFRVAEWAALNWLFMNVITVIDAVFPPILDDLGDNPANNPFASEEILIVFVNEHFRELNEDAMVFLVPWLLPMLPFDAVPEVHQRLFRDFHLVLNNWPQARLLLLAETDAASIVSTLIHDIIRLILSNLVEFVPTAYSKS